MNDSHGKIKKLEELLKDPLSDADRAALSDAVADMDDDDIEDLVKLVKKFRGKVEAKNPALLSCFIPL